MKSMPQWCRMPLIAVLLIAGLTLLFSASRVFRADLAYAQAELEISFWGQAAYTPTQAAIDAAGLALQQALYLQPQHPDYVRLQARYFMWLSYWSDNASTSTTLRAQAEDLQLQAAALRPAHAATWRDIEFDQRRAGKRGPVWQQAVERLRSLEPES